MDSSLRIFAAGGMTSFYAICLITVWRRISNPHLRWSMTLFASSGVALFLGRQLLAMYLPAHGWIDDRIVYFVTAAHWAWFLLLVQVLFDDQKLRPGLFAPAAALFTGSAVMFLASHLGNRPVVQLMS